MKITEQIKSDMKDAMRAKEPVKVMTLRSIMSAFTNELVASKRTPQDELSDDEAMAVIKREGKKRKDSITQYTDGGRPELAADEQVELEIIEKYLPAMMTVEQIKPIVESKMAELGVTDKSGMGQLMGAVMKETGGMADGNDVKEVINGLLS
ncbi:MAG: GatB/YqeY domain-containing protein [Candidatus Nomurabacteria bacterium]|nr:GatB/YqeY domain-containing protein [Candidatus Nomurabacteria bacterium]